MRIIVAFYDPLFMGIQREVGASSLRLAATSEVVAVTFVVTVMSVQVAS